MVWAKVDSQGLRAELRMPKSTDKPEPGRALSPAAQRALREAEERRRLAEERKAADPKPKEVGGPKGPEPTRYGDWEKDGLTSDF